MKINKLKSHISISSQNSVIDKHTFIGIKLKGFFEIPQLVIIILFTIIIFVCFPYIQSNSNCEIAKISHEIKSTSISKEDVRILLRSTPSSDLTKEKFITSFDHNQLLVNTSLDSKLQESLLAKIDRSNSRHVAIVVMKPDSGKIIVMSGFNKDNPDVNPCIISSFPAASIFKIITAAAAIEKCGYSPNSILNFNGCKYTLYKRQIVDSINRYTNKISLKNSFAQSVNPVFGKIGSLYLGANNLRRYGSIFGFNREISFEIPLNISKLIIEEDPYNWAEVASGFNRQTTISPLHGAVIASAIVNDGIPVEPTIIDQILDKNGTALYTSRTKFLDRAVNINTASILGQLMMATVTSGTGRKSFEGYKNSNILSRLNIGGKTGSIYNKAHDTRFDWFVGFAENKCGTEKIVVSVVVAHGKYIGIRAGQYARMAIENYFKNFFEK